MIIRLLDIILSAISIIVLAPLFLLIILLLKFTGEGEIFFLQERVGIFGYKFKVIKFVTMLKNSPETGVITIEGDPRILPIGKFLRRSKINELPQLFNIFFGDMSFVGPRPQTERCFQAFSPNVRTRLIKVKPGLSGIGSIVFRDEEKILSDKKNYIHFYDKFVAPYKGELEIWFVNNYSFSVYIKTIILTIIVIIKPRSKLIWRFFDTLPKPPTQLNSFFF